MEWQDGIEKVFKLNFVEKCTQSMPYKRGSDSVFNFKTLKLCMII